MSSKGQITLEQNKIPRHVAVIMDGNGRWAKQRGLMRIFGHRNAMKAVRETVEAAAENGVEYLTLYAFSTENWSRPTDEVNGLWELLIESLHKELDILQKNDISLHAIGDIQSLPKAAQKNLQKAIDITNTGKRMRLILALSYSSRWEIINAVKEIAKKAYNHEIKPDDIDAEMFSSMLCTAGIPDPELMIRTSGEQRISNYLLWQLAYAELYFTPKLWPDFRKEDFIEALHTFQQRERRFGKTGDQIVAEQNPQQ